MKKQIYFSLLLASLTVFTACSTDDDNRIDTTLQIAQLRAAMEGGTWQITNFNDSGQDQTSDFNGYDFTFVTDGRLIAFNGTITQEGTWSITNDNDSSANNAEDDDIDFDIFFPESDLNNFDELTDDWDIFSSSSAKVELIDLSDLTGDTELLTFEKN